MRPPWVLAIDGEVADILPAGRPGAVYLGVPLERAREIVRHFNERHFDPGIVAAHILHGPGGK